MPISLSALLHRAAWLIAVTTVTTVEAMAAAAPAAPASAAAATVKTTAFEQIVLRPRREAAAVVVARNDSRISAEVTGTVQRWGADTGASVKRGELLVEIDATDHRLARDRAAAALAAAQARAQLALAQQQRAKELQAQGFVSNDALAARAAENLAAQAEQTAARLALASSERALAKARVLAPFDASVRQRLVQTGEVVAPGAPLYQLAETSGAELSAQLAPDDALSLAAAASLEFVRDDGSRTALKLLRVAATLVSPARTVEVRLSPAAGGPALVPGRDGRLVWGDKRLHVPAALLVRRNGLLGVFSAIDGRARFVPLPGAQEGRAAPAPQIAPGTLLVNEGQQALQDGMLLRR